MHTATELGHSGDVLATVHALKKALENIAEGDGRQWWGSAPASAGSAPLTDRGDMGWAPRLDLASK
jgi:hypothetical protein